MINLPRVTIICADTKNYAQALYALKSCLKQVTPARCVFLTDIDISHPGIEVVKIPRIGSKREYSKFMIKELYKHFDTSHCLLVQWDGFILCGESWNPEFLEYDYIGAPWIYEHDRNIANGGFSARSHKLCKILGTDPFIEITHPEDQSIGILYRGYLEKKHGIKFPSEELADTFAYELKSPMCKTFGFHGHFHEPYKETIMITRAGAGGDIVHLEPVMRYYHEHGYKIALNTAPHFFNLFTQHYFKVHHPQELDRRVPVREINLNMAYEIVPQQNHLKSYFEVCGISDYKLSKPKLTLSFDPKSIQNKLFPKYCVIHNDIRQQAARNSYGVNWLKVVRYLKSNDYEVVQIGNADHEDIQGAVQFKCPSELMLMWLVGGADLMLGVDSGPANIAVAMGTPAVIFFGNVEPTYIHSDMEGVYPIEVPDACDTPKCWHSVVGCVGQECVIDQLKPPCVQFTAERVIEGIKKALCK